MYFLIIFSPPKRLEEVIQIDGNGINMVFAGAEPRKMIVGGGGGWNFITWSASKINSDYVAITVKKDLQLKASTI